MSQTPQSQHSGGPVGEDPSLPDRAEAVFVIDDDKAVRESLRWLIESAGLGVETFRDAREAFDRLTPDDAGCLVVDVRLPGPSGLDLQDMLRARGVEMPLIFITGHGDVPLAVRALKGGAVDFIEKPCNDDALLGRVREALRRDAARRALRAEHQKLLDRLASLTPREREVMEMVVEGKLNKQIAADLGLSHKTIEVHRAHVMTKMRAASLADLVRMAVALEPGRRQTRASA